RLGQHRRSHIHTNNAPLRSDHACRDQTVEASPAPDVHDALAWLERAQPEGIAGASEGRERVFGNAVKPGAFVAEQVRERAARVEVETLFRGAGEGGVLVADRLAQSLDVERAALPHHVRHTSASSTEVATHRRWRSYSGSQLFN